ncbi:DKNYY family protein [Flavobacterium limicola]|uniref:DKNYY family protein n=1 Tax=Flavobacterium limicola TaxID=180441 RepID=A0A495RQ02_9FLAO|nr:DKNYY domain-containing protein [Flavobacterium limicola]RKS89643.1 DKNYY family protein [Flavobacterium limicola]
MISKKKILFLFLLTFLITSCNPGYRKIDNKWAYVTYDEAAGRRVRYIEVDNETFEILKENDYAKDKSKVFYTGTIIPTADSKTFNIIGQGYSKDNFQVFMDNEIMIGANPLSFKMLDYPYSRDDNTIFCGTIPMDVKDVENFKVIRTSGGKTTALSSHFIKFNPEFSFIDTLKYNGVIYGDGQGETLTEKFDGYKKKK